MEKAKHCAEIIRPEMLGHWALEKNPTLQFLHEAMQDWGERRGNPSRRPVCMTCPHEFHVNASMPSAWMFVRLSVNKAGVPRQMILVGVCEKCATKDDVTCCGRALPNSAGRSPTCPSSKCTWFSNGRAWSTEE